MADILQKLFGSSLRVKLLRLFLFNPRQAFTLAEAATRTRTPRKAVRREVALLTNIELIESSARKREKRFSLKQDFAYLSALQNLLLNTPVRGKEIYDRIHGVGVVKLIVITGVFMGEQDIALDLFIVGDRVKEKKLKEALRALESEIGKELRYALLSTEEFFYRINLNDRLVRDVFDYPHTVVYDKLNIGLK